jgi:hypothetical protein
MHHGYRVAAKVLEDQAGTNPSPAHPEYLTAIQRQLTQPVNVYICCFCKADNLLSQWRGYGANGTGVSIAIDPTGLRDLTGPDSPPAGLIRLWEVFYKEQDQREIIQSLIGTVYSARKHRRESESRLRGNSVFRADIEKCGLCGRTGMSVDFFSYAELSHKTPVPYG